VFPKPSGGWSAYLRAELREELIQKLGAELRCLPSGSRLHCLSELQQFGEEVVDHARAIVGRACDGNGSDNL
jgi:hypothetical protein